MTTGPQSTYRLQVNADFDLHRVAEVAEYIKALGVDCLYLSPLLPSVEGSNHGYDVVAWDGIDPSRGGRSGWYATLREARRLGLKVIVDIVPNHAGVEQPATNSAWWDVLKRGESSEYAPWFDIDWQAGPLLIPVLGTDFEPGQLRVENDSLCYFEHRFPLAPGTGSGSPEDVHERQHYRLVDFRRADAEQNYRRFFAVSTLAGLRVEDPEVFTATHREIARWFFDDGIAGVRVDHPDGLSNPLDYLTRLRALAGDEPWILVEKILEPHETLPSQWPVDGTTGYDALNDVSELFIDPCAAGALDQTYRTLTGDEKSLSDHVLESKRQIIDTILHAELLRLARLAPEVPRAADALTELLVRFPVYRSYLPTGRAYLESATRWAMRARPDIARSIAAIARRLAQAEDELSLRFQQTSAAVMAKGVEDTAYYRYTRFIALNEVGCNPERIGHVPAAFHQAQIRRVDTMPASMTTLSTHDTKRGEDVRARLAVLSELAAEWNDLAAHLMSFAPLDDRPLAYLIWQSFVGTGFIAPARMHAWTEKAMREAACSTSWVNPNHAFEQTVHQLVDRAYTDPQLREPLEAFVQTITPYGWSNALGQKLVQLTMPGIPDVYQGTEVWEDSLVDPDNRRRVDFAKLQHRLQTLDLEGRPPAIDASGAAKLWITSRALRLRRAQPELFVKYDPLEVMGEAARHVVGFDRGGVITIATRLPALLERSGGWRDTTVHLAEPARDVISGCEHSGTVALADLCATYPVALLVR